MKFRLIWLAGLSLVFAACSGANTPQEAVDKTESFAAAIDSAASAAVIVDVPFEKAFVSALADSPNLVEAETEFIGAMTFTSEGDEAKTVTLAEDTQGQTYTGDRVLRWNVLLTPDVPLDLTLRVASGELALDAAGLDLTGVALTAASGLIDANLPALDAASPVTVDVAGGAVTLNLAEGSAADVTQVNVGAGQFNLNVGENAALNVANVNIGAGEMVLDIPRGAAIRLEIKSVAAGSVNLAFSLTRVEGTDADEGIWQTEGFDSAENPITVVIESIAAGRFELR